VCSSVRVYECVRVFGVVFQGVSEEAGATVSQTVVFGDMFEKCVPVFEEHVFEERVFGCVWASSCSSAS
jgi:hypothetical protein